MSVKTDWRSRLSEWKTRLTDWKLLMQKGLPLALVLVFASATIFTVLGAQDTKLEYNSIEEAKNDLQANKQELAAALAETQRLADQLAALNTDMQTLLEKAQEEEELVSDKIEELQNAYTLAEDREQQQWVKPMQYKTCTSKFGYRDHPVAGEAKFHYGVDLAADLGTPIVASRSGTVTVATYEDSAGYYVVIDHLDGYTSRYMHMQKFIVTEGQFVVAGQIIGYCGSSGVSTGSHLHFGIYHNGEAVNPADYITM